MDLILFELWEMFLSDTILQVVLAIVFIGLGLMLLIMGMQCWVLPMHFAVKKKKIDIELARIWYLLPAGILFFSIFVSDLRVPVTITLWGVTDTIQTNLAMVTLAWLCVMGLVGAIVALVWMHYEFARYRKHTKSVVALWSLIFIYYYLFEYGAKQSILFHPF